MDIVNQVKEGSLTILGVFDEEIHVDYFGQGVIIRATRQSNPTKELKNLYQAMKGYTDFKSKVKYMKKFNRRVKFMENVCWEMLEHIRPEMDRDYIHECLRVDWFIYNGVWTSDYTQPDTYIPPAPPAPPALETYQVPIIDNIQILEADEIAIEIDVLTLHNVQGTLVRPRSRGIGVRYGPQYTCMVFRDMSGQALAAPHGAAASALATITALGAANAIRDRMQREDHHELRLRKLRGYVRHTIKYEGSTPELRERIVGVLVDLVRHKKSWAALRPWEAPPGDRQRRWAAQIRTTLRLLHEGGLAWAGAVGVPAGQKADRLLESVDLEKVDLDSKDQPWLMRNFARVVDLEAAIASDNEALHELDELLSKDI